MKKYTLKLTIFALMICITASQMHSAWFSNLTNRLSRILEDTALAVENPLELLRREQHGTITGTYQQCSDINQEKYLKLLLKTTVSKSNKKGTKDAEGRFLLRPESLHIFDLPAEILNKIVVEPIDTTRYFIENVFKQPSCSYALAILPGGILASSKGKGIELWSFKTGACQRTLGLSLFQQDGHTNSIMSLAAFSDGTLASGSSDRTVKIWNTTTGNCISTLRGHESIISSLVALPEDRLASGSWDNTVKIWDIKTGNCLHTLSRHVCTVTALAFLGDNLLASGSEDDTIHIWDISTGACINTIYAYQVTSLAYLGKNMLASGSTNGTIKVWDTTDGSCVKTFDAHMRGVTSLAALSDGTLVSASKSGSIKFWNFRNGICLNMLGGHTGEVTSLVACPSKNGRFFSASHDKTINTWRGMPIFGISCER